MAKSYTNPDGSPRYTFSHSELVGDMRSDGVKDETIDAVINSFVHAGAWDMEMDGNGETWYTVRESARMKPPRP